jgi:nucleoside-diphosphate-sugar epimerase
MKFLVTGGAGLLGSEIIKMFSSSGFETIAFDLPNAYWETVRGIEGVKIHLGDITDPMSTYEACQDVDAVIHLAAILPPKSEANRQFTMRVNIEGTKILLEALKEKHNVPLVFASSISTYGVTASEKPPIGEDHPQNAHNIYAKSKIEAEHLIKSSGIPFVILRIAPLSVADLIELPEVIPYRKDQRVEFVYATDAAQALFEAVDNPDALGKTFNIAGGSSWQMTGAEYITRFYDALGVDVDAVFSEEHTALDWYDTSHSQFLDYQKTSFNDFLEELRVLAEELGLI